MYPAMEVQLALSANQRNTPIQELTLAQPVHTLMHLAHHVQVQLARHALEKNIQVERVVHLVPTTPLALHVQAPQLAQIAQVHFTPVVILARLAPPVALNVIAQQSVPPLRRCIPILAIQVLAPHAVVVISETLIMAIYVRLAQLVALLVQALQFAQDAQKVTS